MRFGDSFGIRAWLEDSRREIISSEISEPIYNIIRYFHFDVYTCIRELLLYMNRV